VDGKIGAGAERDRLERGKNEKERKREGPERGMMRSLACG